MSIRPGRRVRSPRSISVASPGSAAGPTDTMRLPSTTTTAGVADLTRFDIDPASGAQDESLAHVTARSGA